MADIVGEVIRKSPPLTFNIDYFDYIANVGYKEFYACGGKNAAGNTYFLTADKSIAASSDNIYTGGNSDIDFDLVVNNPVTIAAGKATINTTFSCNNSNIWIRWTIYHVRGGTETSLGTADTATYTEGGGILTYYKNCVQVTLTKKSFKVGDIIRVNATATTGGAGANKHFWHDPAGSVACGDYDSNLTVILPFKVAV